MKRSMKKMVRNGLVPEINTSVLRKGESHAFMPGKELLTLYRQAGGVHVTLGNDAHCAADLCAGFSKTMELVTELHLCRDRQAACVCSTQRFVLIARRVKAPAYIFSRERA